MLFVSFDSIPSLRTDFEGVELRLDLFSSIDLASIQEFIQASSLPILLTVRSKAHGGNYSQEDAVNLITKLLLLNPDFLDLEWDLDPGFIQESIYSHPEIRFILSYHNFSHTPSDIEDIFQRMQTIPAFAYKIATLAQSANDALRLFLLAKKQEKLSTLPMGEKGSFARILSHTLENKVHFSYVVRGLAPGQISLEELSSTYNYKRLSAQTKLYGLIGDPISKSIGHLYHNDLFRKKELDALYVKMSVLPEELEDFLPLAKKVGFQGLSVTMPLKEIILPFIKNLSPVPAVNTLVFEENEILGFNTDGKGALDALEKHIPIQNKKVVLLGAGGAALAIAFEAKSRGAFIYIVNRTFSKARTLAAQIGGAPLEEIPTEYDVLINTTPLMPIDPKKILSSATLMDITYFPKKTIFLEKALLSGCQVVYGEEMFYEQAVMQGEIWEGKIPLKELQGDLQTTYAC